jgi:hypothetical protein
LIVLPGEVQTLLPERAGGAPTAIREPHRNAARLHNFFVTPPGLGAGTSSTVPVAPSYSGNGLATPDPRPRRNTQWPGMSHDRPRMWPRFQPNRSSCEYRASDRARARGAAERPASTGRFASPTEMVVTVATSRDHPGDILAVSQGGSGIEPTPELHRLHQPGHGKQSHERGDQRHRHGERPSQGRRNLYLPYPRRAE